MVLIHLYLPPFAFGSNFTAASEAIDRQAANMRTLCGLPLPAVVDERAEGDLPPEKRCDACVASGSDRFRPKFVVLPG